MSNESNVRDYYYSQIEEVRQKRIRLGRTSHVGAALTDDVLSQIEKRVATESEADLVRGHWPYIFSFCLSHEDETLAELDVDLELVLKNTDPARKKAVTTFLQGHDRRTGVWFGGLFETWIKATFLRNGVNPQLDVSVPNGRDHDVAADINGRRFHFECTVLTEDDESREVWDRFQNQAIFDASKVLIRPGAFCPPNAKGPSPYYTALRIYAKAYDKLAKNLDPEKSQFRDGELNVLLTCFAGPGVSPDDPGVRWGFEELFANNPKMVRNLVPESFTDISLDAWADYRAKELIANQKMTIDWYRENSNNVLRAPRRLGGALIFDNSRLAWGRLNYNASKSCDISHSDMAELEQLLSSKANYL